MNFVQEGGKAGMVWEAGWDKLYSECGLWSQYPESILANREGICWGRDNTLSTKYKGKKNALVALLNRSLCTPSTLCSVVTQGQTCHCCTWETCRIWCPYNGPEDTTGDIGKIIITKSYAWLDGIGGHRVKVWDRAGQCLLSYWYENKILSK